MRKGNERSTERHCLRTAQRQYRYRNDDLDVMDRDVSFDLDVPTGEIRYSIVRKTWIVPTAAISSGIEEMIENCRAA